MQGASGGGGGSPAALKGPGYHARPAMPITLHLPTVYYQGYDEIS